MAIGSVAASATLSSKPNRTPQTRACASWPTGTACSWWTMDHFSISSLSIRRLKHREQLHRHCRRLLSTNSVGPLKEPRSSLSVQLVEGSRSSRRRSKSNSRKSCPRSSHNQH
uniref:Secreted protein n=1 Tax=Macrostomum lignano TaxID=282301 RepID=A0A1I8GNA9_9PLAT